jgi:5-methyltetrahydrofolate--homocysteine methyltransferase
MADFIAPTGHPDHMAMFAVSCMGCDAEVQRFEAQNDDYSKIMAQALADRYLTVMFNLSNLCFV